MLPRDGHIPQTAFRRKLETLTSTLIYERIGEQAAAVEALRAEFPHSLELVAPAIPDRPETFRFTCFQYAFRLTDPPEDVVEICTKFPEIYPSSGFVSFLIGHYLTPVDSQNAVDGDIVVYFADNKPVHAAIVDGRHLVSKWGLAHLWRHPFDEVPERYGNGLRVFKPLSREDAITAFMHFAVYQLDVA